VYPKAFDYVRAASWSDAVDKLRELGDDAHLIAGGQSLVPMMNLHLASPGTLIDIGEADARTISVRDGRLVLSALARHTDLEHSQAVAEHVPMLTEAVREIGNVRVRHRGTIGGSLAHADPTSELACVALAHGAIVYVLGPDGERELAVSDLAVTHLMTTLAHDEVITRVEFPVLGPGQGSCFLEIAPRKNDFAIVEVAALVTRDEEGKITGVRLALGAVTGTSLDASGAAGPLLAGGPEPEAIAEVAARIAADTEVGPHSHVSIDYRRRILAVLVRRALERAGAAAQERRDVVRP
jgi:CO/xanthine dehydrogenase FAD-binding subunit